MKIQVKQIINASVLFLIAYSLLISGSVYGLTENKVVSTGTTTTKKTAAKAANANKIKSAKLSAKNDNNLKSIQKILYKNPKAAIKKLKILINKKNKNLKNAKIYYYLGQSYFKLNNDDKAIMYYKKAIKQNPKYIKSYNSLGLLYNKNHNYKNAYIAFSKLVKINSRNPVYYNNLGFIEEEREKNHKAIEFFNKAVSLNPFYTMAYLNLGSIFRKLGEDRRAAKEYNKSGLTYFRTGNYLQAINSFKLSIKLYRNYIYPYKNIANTYVKLGNIDNAVNYYTLSGNLYNNMQKYNAAVKEFNSALKYNQSYMPAIHGIMLSYQKLGNMQMVSRYMQEEIKVGGIGAILVGGL